MSMQLSWVDCRVAQTSNQDVNDEQCKILQCEYRQSGDVGFEGGVTKNQYDNTCYSSLIEIYIPVTRRLRCQKGGLDHQIT